jgi:hypothetical protein
MNNSLRNRPFGTRVCSTPAPALKRWAILVSSLRDDSVQILVALGVLAYGNANCFENPGDSSVVVSLQDEAKEYPAITRFCGMDYFCRHPSN